MHALAFIAGALMWWVATWSVLRTLVVPRGASKLIGIKNRLLRRLFRRVGHLGRSYEWRDAVLMWLSPVAILSSLVLWLLMYLVSYALMIFGTSDLSVAAALREGGSSLFTLGFASSDRSTLTGLDFVAAATGPIVIGLLIAYLPTMYAAYQRREADVALLLARGGEPNWAPQLLARHAMVDNVEGLELLWERWEQWAAEVTESHTNFPVLVQMRSPRPERNWLVALLSVMDAAAMHMALNPSLPQGNMRVCLRQGIVCLQQIAMSEGLSIDEDPSPDTPSAVSADEFGRVCARLREVGYTSERSPALAYPHFRGWRANYEPLAYQLADLIDAVPAPWSGPRTPPLEVIAPRPLPNRQPTAASE